MIVASLMATASKAQVITIEEERDFYQKVFALFNEYAQSASLSDESEQYTFRKLFANGDLKICNDLMSLNRDSMLTVDNYINILQDAKRVKVVVRNLKKDGPVEDNGDTWVLPIAFEKGISYSKSGTLFNSYDFFGEYYRLRANLSLNKYTGECYISKLEADPKYNWLSFPEHFRVLERTREDDSKRNYKRDSKLAINGRDISWNLYGQVLLHEGDKIKYNNSNVELEEITSGKDGGTKLRANYNDKSFRVRGNMNYSLSGFNKLSDANPEIKTPQNKEMSFGIDIGYVLPSTSKFYFGFFTGVNISSNKFTMEMAPQTTSDITDIINCTEDEDGDMYTRHYIMKGNGVSQQLKATNLSIPLYGDIEYQLTPLFSVYADLGLKLLLSSGTWAATIDGYETTGKNWNNPFYRDVEIKGDVNLNGFGSWPARNIDVDEDGMKKTMSINVIAGLGLRLNLSKSFAVDAGVQYMTGGKSWKMEDNKKCIFDYTIPAGVSEPSDKAKGDRVNLLRQTSGINNSALKITASIIYKF